MKSFESLGFLRVSSEIRDKIFYNFGTAKKMFGITFFNEFNETNLIKIHEKVWILEISSYCQRKKNSCENVLQL